MGEIVRNAVFDANDSESGVPAALMQSSPTIRDRFLQGQARDGIQSEVHDRIRLISRSAMSSIASHFGEK